MSSPCLFFLNNPSEKPIIRPSFKEDMGVGLSVRGARLVSLYLDRFMHTGSERFNFADLLQVAFLKEQDAPFLETAFLFLGNPRCFTVFTYILKEERRPFRASGMVSRDVGCMLSILINKVIATMPAIQFDILAEDPDFLIMIMKYWGIGLDAAEGANTPTLFNGGSLVARSCAACIYHLCKGAGCYYWKQAVQNNLFHLILWTGKLFNPDNTANEVGWEMLSHILNECLGFLVHHSFLCAALKSLEDMDKRGIKAPTISPKHPRPMFKFGKKWQDLRATADNRKQVLDAYSNERMSPVCGNIQVGGHVFASCDLLTVPSALMTEFPSHGAAAAACTNFIAQQDARNRIGSATKSFAWIK